MKKPITVLIVDDEEIVRVSLEEYLSDEGFYVCSVESGEEALEILAKKSIDIGIIDMRLPGIDGNTLIIEAMKIKPKLKCVIHTGSMGYSIPVTLDGMGISEDLVFKKPIKDLDRFVKVLRSLVGY